MKRIIVAIMLLALGAYIYAQNVDAGDPDAEAIGAGEEAQQELKEISVDKFEHEGYWTPYMSSDTGYATTRLFAGAPKGKEPIEDEQGQDIPDRFVLGTRVDFLHRGHTSFVLRPNRPIPIEGITKIISVWVVGRNFKHDLTVLIEDFFGKPYELYMGSLNFQGWKQLKVAVPPQTEDGTSGIVQRNYHYNTQLGIKIRGFRIDVDPMEALGSYYVYFDDLRAVTDLFAE
ncbi:MAG: flagellar filament outer layer protein FlaA, partial [Treponema sp.]|nr:flagellar filament outer layer protein FlaA [Treponema sp.]